ncbi:BOS complex subunit NCLN-like [Acipenser ruthenus]|uniref:BOS complex subunit NCLN-like n=1 Tax=Acipenser ruthenus TaxID=7906 RepID=UPI0027416E0C|nr:BOS complex subunit NCLN-like [Acipenser ruthenus]
MHFPWLYCAFIIAYPGFPCLLMCSTLPRYSLQCLPFCLCVMFAVIESGSGLWIAPILSCYHFSLCLSSPDDGFVFAFFFLRYNILFSLTGGGKFNYQGTKRWIEEHLDHSESSLLHDNVAFVLCLDTLGNGEALHLHVSRPPRPGTVQHAFIQQIEQVVSSHFPAVTFGVVHKKINLGDTALAWEHERFGIRRIPGFTLSHLEDPLRGQRGSILDTVSQMDIRKLRRNTAIVAEALARFMYNFTEKGSLMELQVFKGRLEVQESRLSSLVHWLSSQSRAAQLLERDPGLLPTLELQLSHYLRQVQRHTFLTDKRDPDYVFFDQMKQTMTAYRVKPAVFDLFLVPCIAACLGVVYHAIQNFGSLYTRVTRLMVKPKQQ